MRCWDMSKEGKKRLSWITSYQQVFDEQMSQVASCKARKVLSKHNLFHSGFLLNKGIKARCMRVQAKQLVFGYGGGGV